MAFSVCLVCPKLANEMIIKVAISYKAYLLELPILINR